MRAWWLGAVVLFGVAARAGATPDLAVITVDASAVTGSWQTLLVGGRVAVEIVNGGVTASTPCTVLLFEDTDRSGWFEAANDVVLGTEPLPALAASSSASVSPMIAATVRFRADLIHAFVDSDDVVAETDETNNVADSGGHCTFTPTVGAFDPVVEWQWASSSVEPDSLNVMSVPAVIDLDGDGRPEVVFPSTASRGGGLVERGVLRALDGRDGSELWTVSDPTLWVNTASSVAAGDIDGDGLPEIIACDDTGARLIAFEHDGTFKWRSPTLEAINWGAPSIADLDRDGAPEIIIGRQVLQRSGLLLWTGTGGSGGQGGTGPLSAVADIDLDGRPEIVAGNTVYDGDGAIEWQVALPDGYVAIGDFDADAFAEIVLVASGQVWLLEHDGTIIWGPSVIPGGGVGGAPTVADYDSDGLPEIGAAGATSYAVFDTDGTLLWQTPTQDASSNRTGSSAFDFDGDGTAEVVYSDELTIRVYRGADGAVLFETPLSSATWHEYPIVADVDADGNAEMIAVANDNGGLGTQRGIRVFGDATDSWVLTRALWNQHTYHITNILDDGTVPSFELNNWRAPTGQPYNNYRQNVLTDQLLPRAAPDLTASVVTCRPDPASNAAEVGVRVGNGGAVTVTAGVPVTFYDGDPRLAGVPFGTVATPAALAPGEFVDLTLTVAGSAPDEIFAVADDLGAMVGGQSECDEDNNLHGRAPPTAVAGVDRSVCERVPLALDAGGSSESDCPGGLLYEWRDGTTIVRPESADPIYAPSTTAIGRTTYTVAVRCAAPEGCPQLDDVDVDVRACPLAVRFDAWSARWTAALDSDVVELEWRTAAEQGTLGFRVERAIGASWTAIGGVPAHGAGPTYRVVDRAPPRDARLRYRVVALTATGDGDVTPSFTVDPTDGSAQRDRRASGRALKRR